jgi:hypothetical protein
MAGNRTAGQLSDQIQTLHDKHVSEEQDNGRFMPILLTSKRPLIQYGMMAYF